MLVLLVVAALVIGVPFVLITSPQTFFGTDADAVANSVDSQLPGDMSTFGCSAAGHGNWKCPVGPAQNQVSSVLLIHFTDERCWRSQSLGGDPIAPLHDCLSVKDYVVSNADS